MKSCTFFGHRDTDEEVIPRLKNTILDLIENKKVDVFYIGNNGNFDLLATEILNEATEKYPHISFFVVSAYERVRLKTVRQETIYPLFLKSSLSPIPDRNRWMVEKCDYVVTYVNRSFGGASRFKRYALRKQKIVIELNEKKN